ncbi:CRE-GRL-24 protein [Caenorhabditis remanei]|uniref:CRE-GRL-24 protein n=1 Tax=Caenorhabditis remanei TaxID=31234 RepID=E3MKB0_CAERE|nr:CRE-GRL-24 protein [Caenorhabditis remanei]
MHLLYLFSLSLLLMLVQCQEEDNLDGEKCNDVILYDIIKKVRFLFETHSFSISFKASKTTVDPTEIRQTAMKTMEEVFPLSRSMGCICTDHKFQFPNFTNHRYCSVKVSTFRCHAIVF